MCRLSEAELNCVRTYIRFKPACRQLLSGMSMSRYLPPMGTAGFERRCVSGNRRVPRPPPRTIVRTSFIGAIVCRGAPKSLRLTDEPIAQADDGLDLRAG